MNAKILFAGLFYRVEAWLCPFEILIKFFGYINAKILFAGLFYCVEAWLCPFEIWIKFFG